MAWDGSGNFVRRNGAASGAALWNATDALDRPIRTDDHDMHDEDLAQGIENCIARDGQNTPSSNLPMGGRRHTGVQNAVDDTDYAAWGQVKEHVPTNLKEVDSGTSEGDVALLGAGGQFPTSVIPDIPLAKIPNNVLLFWTGTSAEYAALTDPDQTRTLYLLTD